MAKVTFREEYCKGCGLCVMVCPQKIVSLEQGRMNEKGFRPATVSDSDMQKCLGCAMCATICPDCVIRVEK